MMVKDSLKILSVGNSFAEDTSWHLADVAQSLGFEGVKIGFLYIGGCSINRHYNNALNDLADYVYFENTGSGWSKTEGKRISEAVASDEWDYISIQHGTGDGSRYTLPASYENLEALIAYIKELAPKKAKIAFNMAWVMESHSTHPEICSYNGDQMLMYRNLVELTSTVVRGAKGLDIVSPAGTAVQNARETEARDKLCRDGFHLSFELGRYIASLTFLKALTGVDVDNVSWKPDGVTDLEQRIAILSADRAILSPFAISSMKDI